MPEQQQFELEANIYPVSEVIDDADDDWYEYQVKLVDVESGEVVDEYDSLTETYNKDDGLTEETAQEAVDEIREDVEAGLEFYWFDT